MVSRTCVRLAVTLTMGGWFMASGCGNSTPPSKPGAQAATRPRPTSSSPAGLAALATLKTTAEASAYKSTSSYTDVVTFMKAVADARPDLVHYTTYGMTAQQRAMPLAVVGTDLKDASPAAVHASGKLRVHIQANIHAGEVEGKEASLILLRELAQGQHSEWLKSMVLLITPDFNADGNEAMDPKNRARQNGPINGEGTRQNAQGININRDFTKLETPEAQAFAKLWIDYDPAVGFDLHTSDGSTHGYYLTYAPPLNPDTSDLIMSIMKDEWFPFVTKNIKDKHGWDTFYYGNVSTGGGGGRGRGSTGFPASVVEATGCPAAPSTPGRGGRRGGGRGAGAPTPEVVGAPATPGPPRAWATFEAVPRYHNNYVGLRNRFGLLSEAYAYATFEDRIKATGYFLEEALNFASANAVRLQKAVDAADKESIIGKTEGTEDAIKRGGLIDVLMGEVEDEENPVSQQMMNRRKDVVHHEQMVDMLWFEPTKTAAVPAAYYVPAAATKAIELLKRHGIQMRQITSPVNNLAQFTITSDTFQCNGPSIDTGTHDIRQLDGSWGAPDPSVTAPAGSWVVPMGQPLARLAFYLLEPTSDDGLTHWNYLDDLLKGATAYPILKRP